MHWIKPPGWDSLESVQRIHAKLELISIFLFGALVLVEIWEHGAKEPWATRLKKWGLAFFSLAILAELTAYPYSRRSDSLSNSQIRGDEQIISKMAEDIREARQNAKDASDAATSAKNSAAQASSIARGARQEADSFEKDIAVAKKGAATAESHIQDALTESARAADEARNARMEQAAITAENLRLQQEINPRRLSEEQKQELVAKLSSVLPFTVKFNMPAANDTGEVFDFTDDLKDVFVRMNLIPKEPPTGKGEIGIVPTRVRGVVIGIRNKSEYPEAAKVLGNTLISWGFSASLEEAPSLVSDRNAMLIEVGPKQ